MGSAFSLSVETTFRLQPDWVILEDSSDNLPYSGHVRRLGISTFRLDINTVDELFSESRRMLESIFHEKENAELSRYQQAWKKIRHGNVPSLILAWDDPVILVGSKTFLSDLLSYRGSRNLADPSWKIPYPQTSLEWLMKQHPERVFVLTNGNEIPDAFRAKANHLWPYRPEIVPLDWAKYARISFTPLLEEMK
jgi:ABC-type Fe3+-hydroxamate transport system substrate-binding protein